MLAFLLGVSSWVIVEYLMHRYVLHGIADSSHIPHHLHPKDKSQLFVSWQHVLIVSVVLCGLGLIFFSGITVLLWYLGVVLSYAIYETVHYRVHHCKVKSRLMKYLRKHHLQHHFVKEGCNYSVVFPPLDTLFRSRHRKHNQ
jgi:sterol desaturase/sphingolipid hydroxylase (fatty acid hydroxylase superfamily)